MFTLTGRAFANIAEEDPMEEEDGHGDPVVWDSDSESDDIEEDEDSDDGGFMEFTQILRSVSQDHAGAAEEDDEIDGAVFFGDADEMREL